MLSSWKEASGLWAKMWLEMNFRSSHSRWLLLKGLLVTGTIPPGLRKHPAEQWPCWAAHCTGTCRRQRDLVGIEGHPRGSHGDCCRQGLSISLHVSLFPFLCKFHILEAWMDMESAQIGNFHNWEPFLKEGLGPGLSANRGQRWQPSAPSLLDSRGADSQEQTQHFHVGHAGELHCWTSTFPLWSWGKGLCDMSFRIVPMRYVEVKLRFFRLVHKSRIRVPWDGESSWWQSLAGAHVILQPGSMVLSWGLTRTLTAFDGRIWEYPTYALLASVNSRV
jgi:hypothetical protein